MTDPRDPLHDRLAALGNASLPPLFAADGVRARGEQLRRRQRVVLACAAVVAAAALGGTASLALGSSGQDALRVADPTTSPTPEPTATSAPSPDASPSTTPTPASPSPSPAASAAPTSPPPPSTTSPSPSPPWSPSTGFLSPEAASAAEMPGWFVEEDHPPRLGPGPVVDPCGTDTYAATPADAAERAMSSLRESGGSGLTQRVSRFADAASTSAVYDDLLAAFARCPQAPADDGGTFHYAVEQTSGGGTDRTALVSVENCAPEGCLSGYRSFVLLAQSADGVSEVHYGVSEDSSPQDMAARLLGASADALRAAARPR